MSHFRIIVDNLAKYGYDVSFFSTTTDEINSQSSPWSAPQPFYALASWGLLLWIVLGIEILAQKGYLSDRATLVIQSLISMTSVIGSCCWVWFSNCHPTWGILYLLESVIIWMKLISYVHCNRSLPDHLSFSNPPIGISESLIESIKKLTLRILSHQNLHPAHPFLPPLVLLLPLWITTPSHWTLLFSTRRCLVLSSPSSHIQ